MWTMLIRSGEQRRSLIHLINPERELMYRVIRAECEDGSGAVTAKGTDAGTAARIQGQPARPDWRSEILFLLLTVGPWVMLAWLLWPRR